jgi:hypothetical protein
MSRKEETYWTLFLVVLIIAFALISKRYEAEYQRVEALCREHGWEQAQLTLIGQNYCVRWQDGAEVVKPLAAILDK